MSHTVFAGFFGQDNSIYKLLVNKLLIDLSKIVSGPLPKVLQVNMGWHMKISLVTWKLHKNKFQYYLAIFFTFPMVEHTLWLNVMEIWQRSIKLLWYSRGFERCEVKQVISFLKLNLSLWYVKTTTVSFFYWVLFRVDLHRNIYKIDRLNQHFKKSLTNARCLPYHAIKATEIA